jgi:hypothetical protein
VENVGGVCLLTYPVVALAFILLADPFHLIGYDHVASGAG